MRVDGRSVTGGRRLALASLGAVLALGGCSWMPSWLGGSGSKSEPPAPLVDFKPSLAPRTVWTYSIGSARGAALQPAVLENAIFVAAGNGSLARLGTDGSVAWRIDAADAISGGVGSDGLVVAVGTPRGDVLAFGADGAALWKAQVNAPVRSAPLVGRGLVVVRGSDHRITAFDAATGKRRWTFQRTSAPLTLKANSELAFAGDLVIAGFPSGRVVALAAPNGSVRWDVPVSEPRGATEVERLADVMGAPLTTGGDVCAATFQGRVACINASNGNLRWARDLSAGNGPGGDGERVFAVDIKSNVLAYTREAGTSLWKQDKLLNRDLTTPLALRRAVLVGDYAGYLHFLSPGDGGMLARLSLGSEILAAPEAFGPGAIVQTTSGTVALVALE